MNQLDMFEIEQELTNASIEIIPKYKIDTRVTVKKPDININLDLEDYYYLKDFAGENGYVADITITLSRRVCYQVQFANKIGVFYEEDLD
ncbi:hypothetical protein CJ195_15870 [Bacillus sp. UMB0899]|nr:hypothetical protein CJ195_15870 [Bacillus sp. UMB0899]